MILQFVEMRFPDRYSGYRLLSVRRKGILNGRRLHTSRMLQQAGASAATVAALVFPWTALLTIHARGKTIGRTLGAKWQVRG